MHVRITCTRYYITLTWYYVCTMKPKYILVLLYTVCKYYLRRRLQRAPLGRGGGAASWLRQPSTNSTGISTSSVLYIARCAKRRSRVFWPV